MVATGIYLFGLKGTRFAVAWPQRFPAGVSSGGDSRAWAVPINSFWLRLETSEGGFLGPPLVSPPMEQGPGWGMGPIGIAVAKWAGIGHRLGGSSWGLLTVALALPPLADVLCSVVGFWFFFAGDVRQEQLLCMAVAATMPKHFIASMYASRIEKPNVASSASTKESKLLASVAHECERAAEVCSCLPFEGCT
ncbi:hypothetical protein, conserved [Eimeria brunetti]|uniref:Uncharacterized protein n=1 Tax=Eimeria brunetti TaxID=51314 RepID=U6LL04_9EIME|nr:hypothetical protein, conserved [Eimeria brunetti]